MKHPSVPCPLDMEVQGICLGVTSESLMEEVLSANPSMCSEQTVQLGGCPLTSTSWSSSEWRVCLGSFQCRFQGDLVIYLLPNNLDLMEILLGK